jgi:hypothetical protein
VIGPDDEYGKCHFCGSAVHRDAMHRHLRVAHSIEMDWPEVPASEDGEEPDR